jgi:hypothetical protein
MSKTLLIYERAVAVNKTRHSDWGVKVGNDFSFAKNVNSMPLLAQEFRDALRHYPIVFAGTEEQVMPAVLLGFGENENLFVDEAGMWSSEYIPAFARRYPYVFSSSDKDNTLTLCIDEEYSGFNQDGEGERLFTEDGEQTPYLNGVLEFQQEFQRNFLRTQTFCKRLQELDLLDPMQAQLKFGSGEQISIGGFKVVNRDRLKEVSAEKLSELALVDELELIYLHLQSMLNVSDLAGRIKQHGGDVATGDSEPEAAEKSTKPATKKKQASSAEKGNSAGKKKPSSKEKAAAAKTGGKNKE